MSVLPVGFGSAAGGTPAGAVERSLRFNSADSAGLNRTAGTQTSNSAWTYSVWLKRGLISTAANLYVMRAQNPGNTLSTELFFAATNDTLVFREYGPSAYTSYLQTTQVFRDPSAWYHIVLAYNPANSTSSDKVRLYVNGVRITAFSTATYPSSTSQATAWNTSGNPQYIGSTNTNTFDGYMTEINFIDGQGNLTQNDFGETDSATGVWKPKKYGGTYGNNGFYLPFKTASQWSGYFDGSNDYLSVASNAAWQYGTGDFTVECWLLGTSSGALSNQYPLGRYNNSAGAYGALQIGNSTTIYWYYGNGASYTFTLGTALTTNRWYHFAVSRSGTSLRFFLDGTQIGSTQTDSTNYSGTAEFRIVNAHQSSATYFPGYISNVRVVKGSAVYTANFTPSTTPLTAITNTVLLTCQSSTFIDNSTNNFTITNNGGVITQQFSPFTLDVTDDHSGQGNHWIPNNLDLRTTGTGADILVDSPTSYGTDTGVGGEVRGNYCTMNPLTVPTLPTLANGNLDVSVSATGVKIAQGTFQFPSSGKWYYECTFNNASSGVNGMFIGITSPTRGPNVTRSTAGAYFFYASSSGLLSSNGTDIVTGLSAISANEVFKVAVDIDNSKVWIGRGSTWYNSSGGTTGDPAAGTNPTFSISASGLTPMSGFDASSVSLSMNFGQRAWAQTCPSGFKALCTQNFTTPTIGATSTTQAKHYFDIITWTDNSTGNKVLTPDFSPDMLWSKSRSNATDHAISDRVRGNFQLFPNQTYAEDTTQRVTWGTGNVTLNDGYGVVNETGASGYTYVDWLWKANGAGVTNTAGQITSTVSANNDAGFSIVTYTGNGSANQTVGHGCKVGGVATAPVFGILKDRDTNSNNNQWQVFHTGAGDNYAYLSTTAAFTGTAEFYPTSGSSTTVTVGRGVAATTNESGDRFVMYLFADVEGYSKAFSYASNNTSDNAFVYLGFRPRWIMIKSESTGGVNYDWVIYDTARMTYNYIANTELRANLTTTEGGLARNPAIDILSNGFKVRSSSGEIGSSTLYIGMAFAETPFKYSLAR